MAHKKKQDDFIRLSGDVKRSIVAIFLFVLAFVSFLGFLGSAAVVGDGINKLLSTLFGWGKWLAPVFFVLVGIVLLKRKERTLFYVTNSVGFGLAFVSALGLLHIFLDPHELKEQALHGVGGGYIGYLLAGFLQKFTGMIAGVVILTAMLIISALISFNLSILPVLHNFADRFLGAKEKLVSRRNTGEEYDEEDDEEGEDEYNEEYDEGEEYDDEDAEYDVDEVDHGEENIKHVTFADSRKVAPSQDEEEIVHDDEDEVGDDADEEEYESEDDVQDVVAPTPKPRRRIAWRVPPMRLVESGDDHAQAGDTERNQKIIHDTFANFGIELQSAEIIVGPTVTQYAFRPPAGVKLSRITALANDLALALAAHPIRIEAPIPGKSLIGIEVPNHKLAAVRMRDALRNRNFPYRTPGLQLILGKDVAGKHVIVDLATMPHLLVAGSTGSGKSVSINAMILSMLYQNTPEDLRFIFVDPKRVELSLYNGIPHLLTDVIVDNGKVLAALKWAVGEMERRYALLQSVGSRDIASYNRKVAEGDVDPEEHQKLPAIVIVIDEMADLMASHGKDVESVIVRLAQMARAIGIHLILSTQRPSVEVITGLIKANVPTRIALRVATQVDSRTILDMPGAEKLIGRGDMLFLSPSHPQAKRVQSIFVSEDEVKEVVEFLRQQQWPDDEDNGLDEVIESAQTSGMSRASDFGASQDDGDPLYNDAKNMVIQSQKASTTFLQRKLRIGYSRAASLMDMMEEEGIVSSLEGSRQRVVLVSNDSEDIDPDDVPIVS